MSTGSPEVPNVLVVEDEMLLRMRAVDIVEDADFAQSKPSMPTRPSHPGIPRRHRPAVHRIQMPGTRWVAGARGSRPWPAIKIILVSGQLNRRTRNASRRRFFGKPLGVEKMIIELQAMVSLGTLKIVPSALLSPAEEVFDREPPVTLAAFRA